MGRLARSLLCRKWGTEAGLLLKLACAGSAPTLHLGQEERQGYRRPA